MVKNRKKNKLVTLMTAVLFSVSVLSACGAKTKAENPGEPPAEVLNGDRATQRADAGQQQTQTGRSTAAAEADSESGYEGDLWRTRFPCGLAGKALRTGTWTCIIIMRH